MERLRRLGVARVPAVAVGERAAHGWNPPAYAELLGIPYTEREMLPPAELAARLDTVLATAESLVRQFDARHVAHVPPERKRTVGDLGFHVFRLSLAYVDAMERGTFPETWLLDAAPPDLVDGPAIARYGGLVRGRLAGWFQGAAPGEFKRVIDVYYGPQSGHELLERTAWHAGQHLRQLYVLADRLGVTPPTPLPARTFEGLPLPDAIW
jgi:hypothetical protein